jgi:anti-sigma factor RsiW
MSESPVTEAELQAYVDGRLEGARLAGVEAYLAARPSEAARIASYRTQGERLREIYAPVLDEVVPDRLARAVAVRSSRLAAVAAALAWVSIGALGGWQLHTFYEGRNAPALAQVPIARHAAVAHATYSPEVRHPVEVGADQEAHLVAWLSKRLGAKVRAPNLETVGYGLVGGRLLPGESGPVAQFMYQCKQGTRVTLYVRTEAPDHEETAFRYSDEGGVRVFYWIDRTFGYAVSSADINKDLLLKVANTAYAQLNP